MPRRPDGVSAGVITLKSMPKDRKPRPNSSGVVTLKAVADHLGLTPGTVSSVLNDAPSSRSIPQRTKNRIKAAARELNYRPNFFAQSLRKKRTYTIGVIMEEIGDAYGSMVISGVEQYLRSKNFFFLTVVHRHDAELLDRYAQILLERGVEGFITIDLQLREAPTVPTVAVAGHRDFPGVTNIVLDHHHAAHMALQHLVELGHQQIAFMKGATFSSDSEVRWNAILEAAKDLKIEIRPELTVQIDINDPTPQLGYPFAKQLLERRAALHGVVCLQRSVGAGRDPRVSGSRVARAAGYLGRRLRRHSGRCLQHSQSDDGAPASDAHGRDRGADFARAN